VLQIIAVFTVVTGQVQYQITEKKWQYSVTGHWLFINFNKAFGRLRGRFCVINILIEFGIPMHLVRSLKMWLNETIVKSR